AADDHDAVAVAEQLVERALLEIAGGEAGYLRGADVHGLDRHALTVRQAEPLCDENGLRRRHAQKTTETGSGRHGAEIEGLACRAQPAAPHVVGERGHRELLRDLGLAHERSRSVPANEVPLPDEVVERGANSEPGDAEVRAQLPLGRNRLADGEVLDEIE